MMAKVTQVFVFVKKNIKEIKLIWAAGILLAEKYLFFDLWRKIICCNLHLLGFVAFVAQSFTVSRLLIVFWFWYNVELKIKSGWYLILMNYEGCQILSDLDEIDSRN